MSCVHHRRQAGRDARLAGTLDSQGIAGSQILRRCEGEA
jgi:hypothetical protein